MLAYYRCIMKQAKLNDSGDLLLILSDNYDQDTVVTHKLDNVAEVEFVGDECVAIVLPYFVARLNRGPIQDVTLESLDFIDDTAHFNLDIGGRIVNGKVSFASLKDNL